MTPASHTLIHTGRGTVRCAQLSATEIHRVGYAPAPWEWTPWEYAEHGRFTGRWDDPDGIWRTLYLGATRLSCYLEVLAFARPSPDLLAGLADIDVADDDAEEFPTVEPGLLPRSWCTPRLTGRGVMSGSFAVPGDLETLAALRARFRGAALRLGLHDLDASAIRDGRPRELTQAISKWINTLIGSDDRPISGIQFDSRHGDGLALWALYERPGDPAVSPHLTPFEQHPVSSADPALAEAMRLLALTWADS